MLSDGVPPNGIPFIDFNFHARLTTMVGRPIENLGHRHICASFLRQTHPVCVCISVSSHTGEAPGALSLGYRLAACS
jgi:hypothetical protein